MIDVTKSFNGKLPLDEVIRFESDSSQEGLSTQTQLTPSQRTHRRPIRPSSQPISQRHADCCSNRCETFMHQRFSGITADITGEHESQYRLSILHKRRQAVTNRPCMSLLNCGPFDNQNAFRLIALDRSNELDSLAFSDPPTLNAPVSVARTLTSPNRVIHRVRTSWRSYQGKQILSSYVNDLSRLIQRR